MSTAHWRVDITCRGDRLTHVSEAHADLTAGLDHLTGRGRAAKHPADPDVPAVGAEIAVGRALGDLADQLRALADIEIQRWTPTDGLILLPDHVRLDDPFTTATVQPAPGAAVDSHATLVAERG